MILAFDTYYEGNKAKTVAISFATWDDEMIINAYSDTILVNEPYISGEFYKRELPCILHLYNQKITSLPEAIIVDGFVYLDDENKPGLGGRLFTALGAKIPIIGVGKTNFSTLVKNKREIFRGKSKRPLFITAAGMAIDLAAYNIRKMSGNYRIPYLLKLLDQLSRK